MKKYVLMLTLCSWSVFAQQSLETALLACQGQQDSLQRLVCYDKVVESLTAKTADDVTLEAKESVGKNIQASPQVEQAKAADITPKEVLTEPTVTQQAGSAQAIFGQEQKHIDSVDEVEFVVKSAKQNLRKKWQFEFENGQQWEQKDTEKFVKYASGDVVIIKRGVMNAFYLKKTDTNRTIRVKRIK
ncbi:hypothetical protein [Colwellia sp. MEBiC06753]